MMLDMKFKGKPVFTNAFAFRALGQDSENLPTRFKILNWGKNIGRTSGAEVNVTEKTVAALASNHQAAALDTIPLDYEHQSFPGHPHYKTPPHHYAAHGTVEVIPNDGIYFNVSEYTPNGQEFASSYKDVSAVVALSENGDVLLVKSVALTQAGDIENMEFTQAFNATEDYMDKKYRELLITLLGLTPKDESEVVTDEAIEAAAAAMMDKVKPGAAKTKDEPEMQAFSARLEDIEKEMLISRSVAEGKVIPLSAEDIKGLSVVMLKSIVSKLPKNQINISQQAQGEKPASTVVALSAEQEALYKRLGITSDQFRKLA
jgi:phage I-like protein